MIGSNDESKTVVKFKCYPDLTQSIFYENPTISDTVQSLV